MARYRINNSGATPHETLERCDIVFSHFETWGVAVTGFTINPSQTTIDTDIAVSDESLAGHTFDEHLGFPLTVVST